MVNQVLRNALMGSFRLTPGSFHCVHIIRKECLEELEKTTSRLFIQKLGDFSRLINEGEDFIWHQNKHHRGDLFRWTRGSGARMSHTTSIV